MSSSSMQLDYTLVMLCMEEYVVILLWVGFCLFRLFLLYGRVVMVFIVCGFLERIDLLGAILELLFFGHYCYWWSVR